MRLSMIKRILKELFYAMISSLFLFCISLAIWCFFKDSKTSLQNILFIVGAVPIGFAAIGMFGNFSQRGDASIQLSRTVSSNSLNERAQLDAQDIKSSITSGLNMSLAGLFLWLICYLL
jgi:hypothetical protein